MTQRRTCNGAGPVTVLAALAVLWASLALPVMADGDLYSPRAFALRFKQLADEKDRDQLRSLYHWENVDPDTRQKVEAELERILRADLTSVQIESFPEHTPAHFERDGRAWRINLIPTRMMVLRFNEAGRARTLGLPLGSRRRDDATDYAIAVTVPAVVKPRRVLGVEVVAGESVVAEIVCAYLGAAGGVRKLVQYRGQGSFAKLISAADSFDACAAKKRAGVGDLEIRLVERGSEIYRDSTQRMDHALVYRRH